jgi:hypothetical protein
MKSKVKSFLLLIFLFLLSAQTGLSQVRVKKGFKFGLELLNSFTANTGSFSNSFGYTFGAFTGIKIYSFQSNAIILRLEVNYFHLQNFNPDNKKYYVVDESDPNWNGLSYAVFDEKWTYNIIEFGIIPDYHMQLGEKTKLEIFFGPSFGVGNKNMALKKLDSNKLISDPYDEATMGFIGSACLNLGASIYYYPFVLDIRYRNTSLSGSSSGRESSFDNLYIQAGLAF